MSLTAKPTYRNATCANRKTMSRRDREKVARASATAARPGKVSKSRHLQAIVDAWDAWSPDSWSNQEKWIHGCNAVEAAIESARTNERGSASPLDRLRSIFDAFEIWICEDCPRSSQSTRDLCSAIEAARTETRGGK